MVAPTPAPPHPGIAACLAEIKAGLSADGSITTNQKVLERRSHDVSYHHPQLPHAVVSVASEADIVVVAKACNRYKVPIIPRAGGTSLEGHIIPTASGGIILDVSAMDRIVEVHREDLDVVVEPGVGWVDLREHLEKDGLFFPPDPGAAAC
ncbi:D-lactate ferricytochrome c oxidoreductase, partial [Phlyctochytrium planicorne]